MGVVECMYGSTLYNAMPQTSAFFAVVDAFFPLFYTENEHKRAAHYREF